MSVIAYRSISSLFAGLCGMAAILSACTDAESNTPGGDTEIDGGRDASSSSRDGGSSDGESDASIVSPDADADTDTGVPVPTCTSEHWCHTVLPPDQVLRGVWSDGHGAAWAVSDQGNILRYDGQAWSVHYTRTGDDHALTSIWGSSPTDIWVGGSRSFLHGTGTSSSSITWTEVPVEPAVFGTDVLSIYGTSADDIYAVTGLGVLHYTSARGWLPDTVLLRVNAPKFTAVWGRTGHDDVWISAVDGNTQQSILLQRLSNGSEGAVWNDVTGMSEVQIQNTYCNTPGEPRRGTVVSDSNVWLVGTRQYYGMDDCFFYFHGTKQSDGFSFEGQVLYDSFFKHNDIWGLADDDVWLAGDLGTLQHWDGASWRSAAISVTNAPVLDNLLAIGGRGPDDIWVVGDRIALHKNAP